MTMHYFLLRGHSIEEFKNIGYAEFIFLQSVMEVDLELKKELANSISQ